MARDSTKSAPVPLLDRSEIRSITPSLNPSTPSTRPNSREGLDEGPWKTIDDLELQTLAWVHWHNNERLHSYLGDVPPVEFEAIYDATVSETSLAELTG